MNIWDINTIHHRDVKGSSSSSVSNQCFLEIHCTITTKMNKLGVSVGVRRCMKRRKEQIILRCKIQQKSIAQTTVNDNMASLGCGTEIYKSKRSNLM